jgi:hypothetical protein
MLGLEKHRELARKNMDDQLDLQAILDRRQGEAAVYQ